MLIHEILPLLVCLFSVNGHCSFPSRWWGRKMHGHMSRYFSDFRWDFHSYNHETSTFHSIDLPEGTNSTKLDCIEQYGPFYLIHEPAINAYWCMKEQEINHEVTLLRIRLSFDRLDTPTLCEVCECTDEIFGFISCYPDDELLGLGEPMYCWMDHIKHLMGYDHPVSPHHEHSHDKYEMNMTDTDVGNYMYDNSPYLWGEMNGAYNNPMDTDENKTWYRYDDEYYNMTHGEYNNMTNGEYSNTTHGEYNNMTNGKYYNMTHGEYNNMTNGEYNNMTHGEYYNMGTNMTHGEYNNMTHGEYYNMTHGEYSNTTRGEYYNMTNGEYYNMTHEEYYNMGTNMTHGKHSNMTHEEYYNMTHGEYYNTGTNMTHGEYSNMTHGEYNNMGTNMTHGEYNKWANDTSHEESSSVGNG